MPANNKSVVWIASYPKSGNTWVRFLICNLILGPQDSAAALNRLVPDVHEVGEPRRPLPPRLLMKTHYQFSDQMPLAAESAGAIYVVRNPVDVMLSNFHYYGRSGAGDTDSSSALEAYVNRFLSAGGEPRWAQLGMGRWEDNVRSWIGTPRPFPVLALRYEDFVADAMTQAERVQNFLGLRCSMDEVAAAVAASSFERLRAIEEADISSGKEGIFYKPYLRPSIETGQRFMRAGRSGEGARMLTHGQLQRMSAVFGTTMHSCGYRVAETSEESTT
jgi:hypothetical protein